MVEDKAPYGIRIYKRNTMSNPFLVYNRTCYVPLTPSGDYNPDGWYVLHSAHYNAWCQLTAAQQQVLRDRAKVLVVAERLLGG